MKKKKILHLTTALSLIGALLLNPLSVLAAEPAADHLETCQIQCAHTHTEDGCAYRAEIPGSDSIEATPEVACDHVHAAAEYVCADGCPLSQPAADTGKDDAQAGSEGQTGSEGQAAAKAYDLPSDTEGLPDINGVFLRTDEEPNDPTMGAFTKYVDVISAAADIKDSIDGVVYIYGPTEWRNGTKDVLPADSVTLRGIAFGDAPATVTLKEDISLGGDLTVESDVILQHDKPYIIYCNGYALDFAGDVDAYTNTTNLYSKYMSIYGGAKKADVTANPSITLSGGTFYGVFGGGFQGNVNGSTNVQVLQGATVRTDLYGGGKDGDVYGDATVYVSGAVGQIGASNSISAGGLTATKGETAYVTGKTLTTLAAGAETAAKIYGNRSGQSAIGDGTDAGAVVSEVVIDGIVGNLDGKSSGRTVSGGASPYAAPAGGGAQINGSTRVTVGPTGKILGSSGTIYGGSTLNSTGITTVITGDTIVDLYGESQWVYGGGNGGTTIQGSTYVNLHKGAVVTNSAAGGGSTGSVVEGDTHVNVYNENPASVIQYPNGGAVPIWIIGGGMASAYVGGTANVTVHPGASIYGGLLAGGSATSRVVKGANVKVDNAIVDLLVADGETPLVSGQYAQNHMEGPITVTITGQSQLGSILGSYEKFLGSYDAPRTSTRTEVLFDNATASLYRSWYDIDAISLSDNSKVTYLAAEETGDFENLEEVKDLTVTAGSGLTLPRSNAITGTYTGGLDGGIAGLTLPAGKLLIAAGTVEGQTALTIDETASAALLHQAYLVAQTAGSKGSITWTDAQNRFDLKQDAAVFATAPVNLTASELAEMTGSETADQKWWLVAKATDPGPGPGPGPGPRPTPTPDPDTTITEPETPLNPGVEILDPEVPTTDLPAEEVIIADESVPMGDLPLTGANAVKRSAFVLLLMLALGSAAASVVLGRKAKREN